MGNQHEVLFQVTLVPNSLSIEENTLGKKNSKGIIILVKAMNTGRSPSQQTFDYLHTRQNLEDQEQ